VVSADDVEPFFAIERDPSAGANARMRGCLFLSHIGESHAAGRLLD